MFNVKMVISFFTVFNMLNNNVKLKLKSIIVEK